MSNNIEYQLFVFRVAIFAFFALPIVSFVLLLKNLICLYMTKKIEEEQERIEIREKYQKKIKVCLLFFIIAVITDIIFIIMLENSIASSM